MPRALFLLVLLVACSSAPTATSAPTDVPIAIVANSDLAVGPQRVLLGLRSSPDAAPLEEPGREVTVEFFSPQAEPAFSAPADFLWLVEDVRGVYTTAYSFPEAGIWSVRLTPADLPATGLTPFQVFPDALTPDVGDDAPRSSSLTLADAPLELLTSDAHPDPSFYEDSVASAVSSGDPSVIVFATPSFCQTATCGPTLDVVKALKPEHPEARFVHVEVFDLSQLPELVPVPAVDEWRLPSEPWVFVVDAGGTVSARFEGVITPEELRAALQAVG